MYSYLLKLVPKFQAMHKSKAVSESHKNNLTTLLLSGYENKRLHSIQLGYKKIY